MSKHSAKRRWWRVIDWRAVAVAGLPMWGLVVAVVLWQKFTPKAEVVEAPPTGPQVEPPAPPPPAPKPAPTPARPEVLPPPRESVEPEGRLRPEVVDGLREGGKALLAALFTPRPDDPPPAAPPPKPPVPDGCKSFDTALHFVRNLAEAQKRAKADGRLVFVLHLSGNIEDPGFT